MKSEEEIRNMPQTLVNVSRDDNAVVGPGHQHGYAFTPPPFAGLMCRKHGHEVVPFTSNNYAETCRRCGRNAKRNGLDIVGRG